MKAQHHSDEQTAQWCNSTHLQQLTQQQKSAGQRLQHEMTKQHELMQHRSGSDRQCQDHAPKMSVLQTEVRDVELRLTKTDADKSRRVALANATQSRTQSRDAAEAELQEQQRLDFALCTHPMLHENKHCMLN